MGNACLANKHGDDAGHGVSVPLEIWQRSVQSLEKSYGQQVRRYHKLPRRLEQDYIVEDKVLGKGMSGQVRLAHGKHQEGSFAVKTLSTQGISPAEKQSLAAELHVCLRLDHPLVVRLCDIYESETEVSLVMECMEGGELFNRLVKQKRFPEEVAARLTLRMLYALKYLHHEGIMHGDLKLENLMYCREDSPEDCVKVTDFGLSKFFTFGQKLKGAAGTLPYLAPEALLFREMGPESDLWSLGVIAYILLSGSMPFSGTDAKLVSAIRAGRYKSLARARVSTTAQDFVNKLLVVDSQKRLTVQQALDHPWILEIAKELPQQTFRPLPPDLHEHLTKALIRYSRQPLFRRIMKLEMAWCLSPSQRQSMLDMFLYLDPTREGTIRLHRIEQELQGHLSSEELAQVMKAFADLDTDNDGEFGYTSLLSTVIFTRFQFHESFLLKAFRRLDEEGTGYLTRESLKKLHFREDQVEEILRQGDLDGDGRISFQDVQAFWKVTTSSMQMPELQLMHPERMGGS